MAEQDWDQVTYLRKPAQKASHLRSQKVVNSALRQGGSVETTKKFSAATNKQHSSNKDTARLDGETEELHHETVPLSVGRAIQQQRGVLKLTQKDLATKVNEKPQVINDYEAGRAIPNQQILSKLERHLGIKLRGKSIGEPLGSKSQKK
ncbi:endothelial differentiation-related factor 1 homolog [Lineus longissimus]|uniref:endothelial differentiation-related factor 1 homolog n=1 Tax=Lineus longissimus TaxID=88925 RepID=UPI002B4C965D